MQNSCVFIRAMRFSSAAHASSAMRFCACVLTPQPLCSLLLILSLSSRYPCSVSCVNVFFSQVCLHIRVLTPLKNCFSCPHPPSPKLCPCPHPIRALCPWTCPKHCRGILRASSLPMVMSKASSGYPKGILAFSHGHVQSTVRAS